MDNHNKIYIMKKGTLYTIILTNFIYESKAAPKKLFLLIIWKYKNTLMDNYNYVMCGKIFQFSPDKKRV